MYPQAGWEMGIMTEREKAGGVFLLPLTGDQKRANFNGKAAIATSFMSINTISRYNVLLIFAPWKKEYQDEA